MRVISLLKLQEIHIDQSLVKDFMRRSNSSVLSLLYSLFALYWFTSRGKLCESQDMWITWLPWHPGKQTTNRCDCENCEIFAMSSSWLMWRLLLGTHGSITARQFGHINPRVYVTIYELYIYLSCGRTVAYSGLDNLQRRVIYWINYMHGNSARICRTMYSPSVGFGRREFNYFKSIKSYQLWFAIRRNDVVGFVRKERRGFYQF